MRDTFKIVSNEKLCPKFYKLCLEAKSIAQKAKPGQFVHIRVNAELEPFFRRPFSIHRANKYLEICYEVIGPGTKILAAKKPGENLDILGPLGNGFMLPPQGIKKVAIVAGGMGVAPFLALTDQLKKKYEIILLYGGRTKDHIFSLKAYKDNGCKIYISTDDGSVGTKGRVSELFSKIIPDASTYIYTCGPKPMIKAVQDFANKHQLKGQASLEEVMACGVGVCLGCATATIHGYKTVCHDGPVFELGEVVLGK
ncbi:MAG: dihydroorotate dehydrogenase electron transfer subunit [Candidatus Omnitrophica bacterium]|nr:dihydroorotate dehydrogenase electron transfer subunit [Candidatus Omnitrophota bacterium]